MARSGDESSGFWWLPRGPENKVAGSLSFSDEDGIRLTLIGSFGDIEGLNRFEREPLILGIVKGKLLTLHDCAGAGHSITMPGFVSSSYLIGIVYSGVHFENEEEMIFNRLRVQFDYLADWTQISGFETKITRHPNGQILKYGISYVPPDEVEVQMTSAVLAFESDFTAKQDPPLEANMAQTIWIAIRPKENLSFATMDKDFVYPLRNFLTLATGKPNQITGISVCAAQLDEPLEDGKVQQKTNVCRQPLS